MTPTQDDEHVGYRTLAHDNRKIRHLTRTIPLFRAHFHLVLSRIHGALLTWKIHDASLRSLVQHVP